jgi:hypothetical protein
VRENFSIQIEGTTLSIVPNPVGQGIGLVVTRGTSAAFHRQMLTAHMRGAVTRAAVELHLLTYESIYRAQYDAFADFAACFVNTAFAATYNEQSEVVKEDIAALMLTNMARSIAGHCDTILNA